MSKKSYTERIKIRSLLIPSDETNQEGITETEIITCEQHRTKEPKILQQNTGKHNFTIYRNAIFNCTITYKYKETGLPVDLTNYTVEGKYFLLNSTVTDNNKGTEETTVTEYDLHPVIYDETKEQGKISIYMPAEETALIPIPEGSCGMIYHYYINVISDTGFVYRVLMGKLNVCI